jgi:hypothetical protein
VRIPIPLVILLALSVIGGVWWINTHQMDFLTPPSQQEIAAIKARVEATAAQPERLGEPVKPPSLKNPDPSVTASATEQKAPGIELGDLDSPPTLEAYSDRALDGHQKLAELAALLETEGEFQRSLLAWERSIDLTKPDPAQTATAIAAIRRLRPTLPDWNSDPNAAIQIVLHAGTGQTLADALRPALEEAARELTNASAGILNVTSTLAVGKRATSKGPTPVALWLSGPSKESASTDVLSFTVASNDVLKDEIYKTAFLLISSHIKRAGQYTPPPDPVNAETAVEALESNITRLSWREFGKSLNASPAATQ